MNQGCSGIILQNIFRRMESEKKRKNMFTFSHHSTSKLLKMLEMYRTLEILS